MALFMYNGVIPNGHLVPVPDGGVCGSEAENWASDPKRPGLFCWRLAENADELPANQRWYLCFSDPDVAFEARIRWS